MNPDWIAEAIDPRSRNHKGRRALIREGPAGVKSYVLGTSVTRAELDDKARWLEGQVQGWTAARTL